MKKRLYIETTVLSCFAARPSRDIIVAGHQEATRDLWPDLITKYDTYISALSYEEARKGDPDKAKLRLEAIKPFPMLDIDDEAKTLADKIIDGRGIPPEYPEDALHISVAAVNGIDALITWNFAQILFNRVNMVRAGVVRHPSEWPFSGYNEIQRPRERYALIDYQGLRELLNLSEMADLADAYRGWVEEALSTDTHLRDGMWSESIAACPVKSGRFI